jgi:Leucine-rich repeat (LRR) protein
MALKYILVFLGMMFASLSWADLSITNISVSGGIITLKWNATDGKQYVGSFCTNLTYGRFEYYGTSTSGGTMSTPVLDGFVRVTEVDSAIPVTFADRYLESAVRELIGYPYGNMWNFQVSGIKSLHVSGSSVTNMGSVNLLSGLTHLYCSDNQISWLDLSGLTNLEWLVCDNNSITNMNLTGCVGLKFIFCNYNSISDLQFIVDRAVDGTLKAGTRLWLYMNPLSTHAKDVQIPLLKGTYGFIVTK